MIQFIINVSRIVRGMAVGEKRSSVRTHQVACLSDIFILGVIYVYLYEHMFLK